MDKTQGPKIAQRSILKRISIPKRMQVEIFRRDFWICWLCGRPVIFGPAMRHLEEMGYEIR